MNGQGFHKSEKNGNTYTKETISVSSNFFLQRILAVEGALTWRPAEANGRWKRGSSGYVAVERIMNGYMECKAV